mmetsp:Transcript_16670/g.54710  ORF Transcript_16670/g.54710 Transcript_16670/m.54710 type:complete len:158 (-) Transcript_16670:559-1032(-)
MRMEIDPFKSAGSPKRRPTPGQHFPGCLASGLRGGVFHTLGADGLAAHAFERGDATFFLSQKMHSVSRLDAGERRVLVLELWEGGENHAPSRDEPHRWEGDWREDLQPADSVQAPREGGEGHSDEGGLPEAAASQPHHESLEAGEQACNDKSEGGVK